MTVDRLGSFDGPSGLATDLAALSLGLVGADLLEETATRFGASATIFLFFSATKGLSDREGIEWRPTYLGRALRERGAPFRGPFSWVNAEAVESRGDQMGQRAVLVAELSAGGFPLVCGAPLPCG